MRRNKNNPGELIRICVDLRIPGHGIKGSIEIDMDHRKNYS